MRRFCFIARIRPDAIFGNDRSAGSLFRLVPRGFQALWVACRPGFFLPCAFSRGCSARCSCGNWRNVFGAADELRFKLANLSEPHAFAPTPSPRSATLQLSNQARFALRGNRLIRWGYFSFRMLHGAREGRCPTLPEKSRRRTAGRRGALPPAINVRGTFEAGHALVLSGSTRGPSSRNLRLRLPYRLQSAKHSRIMSMRGGLRSE
jgi:hypothetical protein